MQLTSVLFGFMLCLADASLALGEDGCSLYFLYIKVHNSVLWPVLFPVCFLGHDSGLNGPLD